MYCSYCGATLTPTARFCPKCGTPHTASPAHAPSKTTFTIDGPTGRKTYALSPGTITLGRTSDNMIPLEHEQVSRRHAEITFDASGLKIADLGSTNGTYLNSTRLAQQRPEPFGDADRIQLGPFTIRVQSAAPQPGTPAPQPGTPAPQPAAGATALAPAPAPAPIAPEHVPTPVQPQGPQTSVLDLQSRAVFKLGRAPDNDIVINHPQASRYHAIVERANNVVKLTDLGSTNGTFVNGQRITAPTMLKDGDTIQIASYRFIPRAGQMQQINDQGNISVDALHLGRTVGKGIKILNDVSLSVQPREFVAIVGGSGAGKSTLLDTLNGFRPATEGAVLYNGADLYQNFDAYRNVIGYVPQDDIIHRELTVHGALNYAAQLRLPRDTSGSERGQRINEVLKDLGLEQRRDTPISRLSGGQRKRVSIGVELLSKPDLLFLDEPTSGLDPSTETKMMRLMRELADQGRTVMLVTHVTGNVSLCDKVIIMARGGRLAFYGKPKEALKFFQVKDFVDIYDQVETGKPEDWQKKFEQSAQYQQNVAQPLSAHAQGAAVAGRAGRVKPGFRRISALQQFIILSMRNLEILYRDKASLVLMLMLAPLIGAMDFLTWKANLFDTKEGNAAQVITAMFMAGLITILVGGIASMREIVKEIEVYRRERMVGLGIVPYIFSKIWLGILLALYQALVLVIFKVLAISSMPHDATTVFQMYVTLTLATLAGMLMGLFVSAVAPNQNVAPLLIILLLVPQFLFSGGMLPANTLPGGELIAVTTSTKWAFDSLVSITGMGKAVADDKCWQVKTAESAGFAKLKDESDNDYLKHWQDSLSEEYKKANCTCLGTGIFTACKFPGITKKYTEDERKQVESPEPTEPAKPGDPPSQPGDPPARPGDPPARPDCNPQLDATCAQRQKDWGTAMDDWRDRMKNWGKKMDDWGDAFEVWGNDMDRYKEKTDAYQDRVKGWGDDKKDWQSKREKAIGNAEGLIRKIFEDYGGTFNADLGKNWGAMGIIMGVFFFLIFAAQKYKDIAGR